MQHESVVFFTNRETIDEKVKQLQFPNCTNFRISAIDGLPPILIAIIMNKNSEWFENVNTISTMRLSTVVDRELNMSTKCKENVYEQKRRAEQRREPLQLISMAGLSYLYAWHRKHHTN